jgi:hypothetical protein
MKKNLHKLLSILILLSTVSLALIACRSSTISPVQTTSISLTTETENQQPVNVMSVIGPIQPYNPGGPLVEITLKDIAAVPVVALTAIFTNLGIRDYSFHFAVSASNPLLSGASISYSLTLIGAGFSNNVSYPLTIEGTLQNGVTFSYIVQVTIAAPSN